MKTFVLRICGNLASLVTVNKSHMSEESVSAAAATQMLRHHTTVVRGEILLLGSISKPPDTSVHVWLFPGKAY